MWTFAALALFIVGTSCTHYCTPDHDECYRAYAHDTIGHCGPQGVCECVPSCIYQALPRCVLPCPQGMVNYCDSNDGHCKCFPQMVGRIAASGTQHCTSDQDCPLPCPHHEVGHCGAKGVCECVPACMYQPPSHCFLPCPQGLVGKCDDDGYCRCHPPVVGRSTYGDAKCTVCQFVMTVVDDWLQENATASDIEGVLDVVCSFMPDTIAKECADFVSVYEPVVIRLLLDKIAPDQVCHAIHACTSTHGQGAVGYGGFSDNRTQ